MKTVYLLLLTGLFYSSGAWCQADLLKPQGIYTSNFTIDEISRNITYYTPLRYGKKENYPLLIFLHDDKGSAKNAIKKYGDFIQAKADSADCVVMYPDAVAGHWNSKTKGSAKDTINDAGFISIMLDYFVQQYHCDPERIYLIGIGSGGVMCYRFSCETSSKPAAIATINATSDMTDIKDCRNKTPVPVLNTKSEGDANPYLEKAWRFLFAQHENSRQ